MSKKRNIALEDQFIDVYWTECQGLTTKAAEKLGLSEETCYGWFKNPEFKKRVEERRVKWSELLRAAAFQRAMKKSDRLLMWLSETIDPETYDKEYRRQKWLKENNLLDPENAVVAIRPVLVRGEEPGKEAAEEPTSED